MCAKAGQKKMQVTEKQLDSRMEALGKQIDKIIKDRDILKSCLLSVRKSLSLDIDLKSNDLVFEISEAMEKVTHSK